MPFTSGRVKSGALSPTCGAACGGGQVCSAGVSLYGVSDWTNMTLHPEPHFLGLLMTMAQDKAVCDAYTQNFNHPDRQWDTVATPERTAAFIARHTAGQPVVPAY